AGERRIGVYGAATGKGFRHPPSARGAPSLPGLFALAQDISGRGHHFRVVPVPYNLAMTEAFTEPTPPRGRAPASLLEAARKLDMYVMTAASIYQGQLVRSLPPVLAEVMPGLTTDAQRALQFARSTPGVGTALVGMKSDAHVTEAAGLA